MYATSPRKSVYFIAYFVGFLMPYLTGFLGLMPLDQSIVFEAGGRISRGEMPYRDFYLPYGLVPSLIQSVFFKIFGINWFAYVTQAAIVNGLFTLVTFDCLLMLVPAANTRRLLAGALLAGWAFYPMTGTPFLENHSLFFAVLAYWLALTAFRREKFYLLFFCFPLMVPGFYSKPIPVIFWTLPILLECWFNRKHLKQFVFPMLVGIITAGALLWFPMLIFPAEAFYYNTIRLPFQLGKGRFDDSFTTRFIRSMKYFKIFFVSCVPALVFLLLGKLTSEQRHQHLLRCLVMITISLLFGVITKNAFYNVTTPVFILAFTIFDALLRNEKASGMLVRMYNTMSVLLWVVLIAAITVLNFRRTTDIDFQPADLRNFSPSLGIFVKTPLRWYSRHDIEKLKALIQEQPVLYTGDMQYLFSLTGRKDPLPLTHINNRTTYWTEDTLQFLALKRQIVRNLLENRTQLFIEDESIYNPGQPLVADLSVMKGNRMDGFGKITVYQIDSVRLHQLASSLNIKRDK